MREVEVSCTLCFDDPCWVRGFFEVLVTDNTSTGRPEPVAMSVRSSTSTSQGEAGRRYGPSFSGWLGAVVARALRLPDRPAGSRRANALTPRASAEVLGDGYHSVTPRVG